MKKSKIIIVILIFFLIIACKRKNDENSQNITSSQTEKPLVRESWKTPFTSRDVINIFNNLNIRDAPTVNSNTIRQSSFGDFFYVYDTKGTGVINNGVLDLWYKISFDREEWVNALFVRRFPFYIASDTKLPFSFNNSGWPQRHQVMIKIEAYREIDGEIELQMEFKAREGHIDGSFFNPLGSYAKLLSEDKAAPLMEVYTFRPDETVINRYFLNNKARGYEDGFIPEYSISLINNKFENLRNYILEIEDIADDYKWFIDFLKRRPSHRGEIKRDDRVIHFNLSENDILNDISIEEYGDYHDSTRVITINQYLPYSKLTGVRIGNTKDDIHAQFGNNYDFDEYHSRDLHYEIITFDLELYLDDFPIRLIFYLTDNIVQKITLTKRSAS
jgi:hypothetical protein